mmetsp:Transcript_42926/g.134705  ORF Transcript_42926/g.134705 Transcript_42926/m.134705 type:complete len:247 (-) Transcript_42926:623-1363(-)
MAPRRVLLLGAPAGGAHSPLVLLHERLDLLALFCAQLRELLLHVEAAPSPRLLEDLVLRLGLPRLLLAQRRHLVVPPLPRRLQARLLLGAHLAPRSLEAPLHARALLGDAVLHLELELAAALPNGVLVRRAQLGDLDLVPRDHAVQLRLERAHRLLLDVAHLLLRELHEALLLRAVPVDLGRVQLPAQPPPRRLELRGLVLDGLLDAGAQFLHLRLELAAARLQRLLHAGALGHRLAVLLPQLQQL